MYNNTMLPVLLPFVAGYLYCVADGYMLCDCPKCGKKLAMNVFDTVAECTKCGWGGTKEQIINELYY